MMNKRGKTTAIVASQPDFGDMNRTSPHVKIRSFRGVRDREYHSWRIDDKVKIGGSFGYADAEKNRAVHLRAIECAPRGIVPKCPSSL
jgi:hypothetical protein